MRVLNTTFCFVDCRALRLRALASWRLTCWIEFVTKTMRLKLFYLIQGVDDLTRLF